MQHTLFLFDVDGTLVTTGGAGVRAMRQVGRREFGENFSFDGVRFGGGLDPQLFGEAARQSGFTPAADYEPRFREAYLSELATELERSAADVSLCPGVGSLIATLRQRVAAGDPVMPGLLTGNYTAAMPIKLGAVGLDPGWFPIHAFGDEAETRPELTALAMRRYHERTGTPADPGQVVVIGDTVRDIHCAHAHGCICVAVATGRSSVAELEAAGADLALPDLSDPTPVLELAERGLSAGRS